MWKKIGLLVSSEGFNVVVGRLMGGVVMADTFVGDSIVVVVGPFEGEGFVVGVDGSDGGDGGYAGGGIY